MTHDVFDKNKIKKIVKQIAKTYTDDKGINHLEGLPIPDAQQILKAVADIRFLLFPGFTDSRSVSHANVEYMVGDYCYNIYCTLSSEIETAFHYQCKLSQCNDCDCAAVARQVAYHLLEKIPAIREVLKTDVAAAYAHDPSANCYDEIIMSYPGLQAISTHRIAHELYKMNVPLIPRIINEWAHSNTGIDIHPGATLGEYFFIDHGTGVVIGETTVIGCNVSIYHGVTLGAMGASKGQQLHGVKRHPTIEDEVVIYPGATIIGGETFVGKGCTVGGNVYLTTSVPPYTLVNQSDPELVFLEKKVRKDKKKSDIPYQATKKCSAREFCHASFPGTGLQSCTSCCPDAPKNNKKKNLDR